MESEDQSQSDSLDASTDEETLTSQSSLEITLEHVEGVSSTSKTAVSANPVNGHIAYSASSMLVLLDPRYINQAFAENSSSREITAVTFSWDGLYLAYGEQGTNPCVSVYDAKQYGFINKFKLEGVCTVKALQFHPQSMYLAILPAFDFCIMVYDFVKGKKVAVAKWLVEPLAMSMMKAESTLLVCGHRKVMCYSMPSKDWDKLVDATVLEKRAILLGKQGQNTFVDITSGQESHALHIYAVTSCGYLCQIQSGNILINQERKVSNKINCVKFELAHVFVGCDEMTVLICNPFNLTVISKVNSHDMYGPDILQPPAWPGKPDVGALVISPTTSIVTTVLCNHRMHSWLVSFDQGNAKVTPVIPNHKNDQSEQVKFLSAHDLQCHIAQMLSHSDTDNTGRKKRNFLQKPVSTPHRKINAVKITPDGKYIICGNHKGEIQVYNSATGDLQRLIEAHTSAITFIELLFDEQFALVASGGRDRLIFILNAAKDFDVVQVLSDHMSAIVSISLAHNEGIITLISSSTDGIILIRRSTKSHRLNFVVVGELPESSGFKKRSYNHSNGYIIITGQENGSINLFPDDPCMRLKPTKKIQLEEKMLKTVTIDPTGTFFVANSPAGQYLYHIHTGEQIATLCALPGISYLTFSPDLKYLINSTDFGCKFMWRLPNKIVEIMQSKMCKEKKSKVTKLSKEFQIESYSSCINVCQKFLEEERQSGSTRKENSAESNHSFTRDKDGFVSPERESSSGSSSASGSHAAIGVFDTPLSPASADIKGSPRAKPEYAQLRDHKSLGESSPPALFLGGFAAQQGKHDFEAKSVNEEKGGLTEKSGQETNSVPASDITETSLSYDLTSKYQSPDGNKSPCITSDLSINDDAMKTAIDLASTDILPKHGCSPASNAAIKIPQGANMDNCQSISPSHCQDPEARQLTTVSDARLSCSVEAETNSITCEDDPVARPLRRCSSRQDAKGNGIDCSPEVFIHTTGGSILQNVDENQAIDDVSTQPSGAGVTTSSTLSKEQENTLVGSGKSLDSKSFFTQPRSQDDENHLTATCDFPDCQAAAGQLIQSCAVDEHTNSEGHSTNFGKSDAKSDINREWLNECPNPFYRTTQLSNSQETYIRKCKPDDNESWDSEAFTASADRIGVSSLESVFNISRDYDALSTQGSHSIAVVENSESENDEIFVDAKLGNQAYLKDLFMRWMLKRMETKRKRRLKNSRNSKQKSSPDHDNTSVDSQRMRTFEEFMTMPQAEQQALERVPKPAGMSDDGIVHSRGASLSPRGKLSPALGSKRHSKHLSGEYSRESRSPQETGLPDAPAESNVRRVYLRETPCPYVSPQANQGHHKMNSVQILEPAKEVPVSLPSFGRNPSPMQTARSPRMDEVQAESAGITDRLDEQCVDTSPHFASPLDKPMSLEAAFSPDNPSMEPANSASVLKRIGGVAQMFRNQDEYLQRLKEVRRKFELSIQALSDERKNKQMEVVKLMRKE